MSKIIFGWCLGTALTSIIALAVSACVAYSVIIFKLILLIL